MKVYVLIAVLIVFNTNILLAQTKIHVEDLQPPTDTLQEKKYNTALEDIVYEANKLNSRKYKDSFDFKPMKLVSHKLLSDTFQYNFVAKSKVANTLSIPTAHAFYDGLFEAYAHHRPIVLSPDMIWLLICQGFAQHINNNVEKLRHYFVKHEGKVSLTIVSNTLDIHNPDAPWEKEAFPIFTDSISHYTGKELIDVLTNNFSTSTPTAIAASQITIMEGMKNYFEYVVMYIGCGIPDITLEGTPQDWGKLREKAQYLKGYELGWWIDKIDPILQKFIAASKGEKDTTFWKNIFKYKQGRACGGPSVSNGWIVKFFPYDKEGHRNNLDSIASSKMLPPEITNTLLTYIVLDKNTGEISEKDSLELWAGFVGLSQNKNDFTLKPEIGWMIRKKDNFNTDNDIIDKVKSEDKRNDFPVILRVNIFPKSLLQLSIIKNLELVFTDSINIPNDIKNIQIEKLQLVGKTTEDDMKRITELLPNTELYFNGKKFGNQ